MKDNERKKERKKGTVVTIDHGNIFQVVQINTLRNRGSVNENSPLELGFRPDNKLPKRRKRGKGIYLGIKKRDTVKVFHVELIDARHLHTRKRAARTG